MQLKATDKEACMHCRLQGVLLSAYVLRMSSMNLLCALFCFSPAWQLHIQHPFSQFIYYLSSAHAQIISAMPLQLCFQNALVMLLLLTMKILQCVFDRDRERERVGTV